MNTIIKIIISITLVYASVQISKDNKITYQEKTLEQSIKDGQWVYKDFCVRCHLPSGKGVSGVYPPLDGSNWLVDKVDKSITSLKYGLEGQIKVNDETYNNVMPDQGLSDEEIADVMNYIMNSWENTQKNMVTTQHVKTVVKK